MTTNNKQQTAAPTKAKTAASKKNSAATKATVKKAPVITKEVQVKDELPVLFSSRRVWPD